MTEVQIDEQEYKQRFVNYLKKYNSSTTEIVDNLSEYEEQIKERNEHMIERLTRIKDTELQDIVQESLEHIDYIRQALRKKEDVDKKNSVATFRDVMEYDTLVEFFSYVYFKNWEYKISVEQYKDMSVEGYKKYMKENKRAVNMEAYQIAITPREKYDKFISSYLMDSMYSFITEIENLGGEIISTRDLFISVKGNIDGFVECKDKNIRINTFGAGGYNIQKYHYRTQMTVMNK